MPMFASDAPRPLYDLFISYTRADAFKFVDPLCRELTRIGVTYWIDREGAEWGADVVVHINSALASARFVLLILSENTLSRPWPLRELSAALSRDLRDGSTRLLPLFCSHKGSPDTLRAAYPVLDGLLCYVWVDGPATVAAQIHRRLSPEPSDISVTMLTHTPDSEWDITTAFWAGNFSRSATDARTILDNSLRRGDFDLAVQHLSNLVLIARSRNPPRAPESLLRHYAHRIPFREVAPKFRFRLLKELFVAAHEREDFRRAVSYLARLERLDPHLMTYTPGDDWIPGTLRWRRAHLLWRTEGSNASLTEGLALAQEGVEYLQTLRTTELNSAGLASAHLNVGWLYFLRGDAVCLDYFEIARQEAEAYAPRTALECEVALALAAARLKVVERDVALERARHLTLQLIEKGFGLRSYAFLARDHEWPELAAIVAPGTPDHVAVHTIPRRVQRPLYSKTGD